MINPATLMKVQQAKETFVRNHPKFPMFLQAVGKDAVKTDTVIEISVTTPEGKNLKTNIKLKESDVDFIQELLKLG